MRKDTVATWGAFALFLLAFLCSGETRADGVESFCRPVVGLDKHMRAYRQEMVFAYEQPAAGVFKMVYANVLTGDWTLIQVGPDSVACTAAQGVGMVRRAKAAELPLFEDDKKLEPES